MTPGQLVEVEGLLQEALGSLRDAAGSMATDDELLDALRMGAAAERELQRTSVGIVAALQRRGTFADRGQRADTALSDVLGVERGDARRVVVAAEHVCSRTDMQGQVLPPVLPATAAAFDAGEATLRHVEVIARLLAAPTAQRLGPEVRSAAEAQIAARAADYTPSQLHNWGTDLLNLLDQDGAAPDDREPAAVDELLLTRNPSGSGGRIKGRFDDAAMFDLISAVLSAKSAPLTKDDTRPLGQRQAEAMAEVFGYVADHGDSDVLPSAGGHRPHVNVLIRLEDLQNRARAACLDFAGVASPSVLRRLCCDACVVPIVMNGAGQPLDVGRMTRSIPDGLRRAVAARDGGCAHPGCDRPPSWCEVHHVKEWEFGGETRLDNLVMLCLVHHREIHSSGWRVRIAADGPEFFPPAWIDPEQRPRRRPRLPATATGQGSSPPTRRQCIPVPLGRAGRTRTPAQLR